MFNREPRALAGVSANDRLRTTTNRTGARTGELLEIDMKMGPADHRRRVDMQPPRGMPPELAKGELPRLYSVVETRRSKNPMAAFLSRLTQRLRPSASRPEPPVQRSLERMPVPIDAAWRMQQRAFVCAIGAAQVMHPQARNALRRGDIDRLEDHGAFVIVQPDRNRQEWLYVRFYAPDELDAPVEGDKDGREVSAIKLMGVDPDRHREFLQGLEQKKVLVEGLHRRLLDSGGASGRRRR